MQSITGGWCKFWFFFSLLLAAEYVLQLWLDIQASIKPTALSRDVWIWTDFAFRVNVLKSFQPRVAGISLDFHTLNTDRPSCPPNGGITVYYLHTLCIIYIFYVYIQLYTYLAGSPQWQRAARQQLWRKAVVLFLPKHRLGYHPESDLFVVLKKCIFLTEVSQKVFFLITGART